MSKNIISIDKLSKRYSDKILYENESFGINENDKIGLIGTNGCGKSTFLKILTGKEITDSGSIIYRKNIRIGYLPQIPELNPDLSIYEQIYYSEQPEFSLLRKYYKILSEVGNKSTPELEREQQKIVREIDARDGWKIEIKAKRFLTQLGFKNFLQKVNLLSGGQKRRLDLARVLMNEPDLLILDEPTNHLDIEMIEWLQNYLMKYDGSIIFVTHDRYFLDAVSNKLMDIDRGKIHFYNGNYSYYLKEKNLELVDIQRKETRRAAQLKKELKWLQRGAKARTTKPKKHIERVKELIDKTYTNSNSKMDISFQNKKLGKTILEIHKISKSYENQFLFKNFAYTFQKNDKIGIIGTNGCGKTTLLKIITEKVNPDSGKIRVGINTKFSYFEQENEDFDEDQTVLEYIRKFAEQIKTKNGKMFSASEMLHRFLFDNKMQQNRISSLSGGERKRLYLLKSLMFGSNFIILDEPTNDLDIKTLEILEDYLDSFQGCLLIVSHDRYFLDRIVDDLFIFEGDKIIKFPGNYSDYFLMRRFQKEKKKEKKLVNSKIKKSNKSVQLSYKEKRELEEIENKIEELETQQKLLNLKIEKESQSLTHIDFYNITKESQDIDDELATLTERWLELEEKKELNSKND